MLDLRQLNAMEAELAKRELSVASLCRKAEVDPTTWWRWKTGRYFPSFKASQAVTKAFEDLLAETDDPAGKRNGKPPAEVQGAA